MKAGISRGPFKGRFNAVRMRHRFRVRYKGRARESKGKAGVFNSGDRRVSLARY
jgi:hypothetical protein